MIIQNSLTVQTSHISVILLPLRPASLMHKKSPKVQNNSRHASCRTQRSIDRSEDVFVEKNINKFLWQFLWLLFIDAYLFKSFLCFKKDYILISVNCSKEFWHRSSD